MLSEVDGERHLTDLRHVGQLLHAAAAAERLGATALTGWLRQRIAAAEQETGDEERSRRLESDAEAVQVLTIHRSKGLEFPIVYFPYLWEPTWIGREKEPVFFHDPANGDARTIDVGLDGPDFPRHVEQHMIEARGEDLRLAYVALTRARHQAVVWWAGSANARDSALSRLLFARAEDGTVAPKGPVTPSDLAAVTRLNELAAAAPPGRIGVERSVLEPLRPWAGVARAPGALDAAAFARELDWRWRRTSFSDITAGAYEARVASEPEEVLLSDEPDAAAPVPRPARPATTRRCAGAPAVLAEMGVGVRVGTLVHRVLEATDFAAADLRAELAGARRRGAGAAAGGARRRRARRRRPGGGDRDAARAARGRRAAARHRAAPTGSTSSPSSSRSSAATTRRRGSRSARSPPCSREHLPPGRPARRLRRAAVGPEPAPERARLPHRQPRPRAAARRATGSRSPTTRRTGSPRRARS